jgi:thioredoxin-like negative regulator of GroEL
VTACLALTALGTATRAEPPNKDWLTKLRDAKAAAAEQQKPVLAMVSTSWCPPCNMMKKEILPQPSVRDALKKYVLVYIDGDENRPDAKALKVRGYPTFIVLSAKGEEVGRLVGARPTAEDFIGKLEGIHALQANLEALERNIRQAPRDATLWKSKGDLLVDNNQMPAGVAAYKQAAQLDPENKTGVRADLAFFNIMEQIDQKNDLEAGMKSLKAFQEQYPASRRVQDAMYIQAVIALHRQKMDEAKAILAAYQQRFADGRFKDRVNRLLKMIEEEARRPKTPAPKP